jgi:hypothetical protein
VSYKRVIPRDLFNEASLLKCYGQLYLQLEKLDMEDCLRHADDESLFQVEQDWAGGGLSLQNVTLVVRGEPVQLLRPLNARDPYPLYAFTKDEEEIAVFNDDGSLDEDMLKFLQTGT